MQGTITAPTAIGIVPLPVIIKNHFNVAGAVRYPDNLNAARQWQVKNDMAPDWETAQTLCQFIAEPTDDRVLCQSLKFPVEKIDEGIGS